MIIRVDIDETICETPEDRDYTKSKPYKERIAVINELYDLGHKIIYWTARGSYSGIDWWELTKLQLIEWGAKHHSLETKKPMYELFICDRAVNSESFFKSYAPVYNKENLK